MHDIYITLFCANINFRNKPNSFSPHVLPLKIEKVQKQFQTDFSISAMYWKIITFGGLIAGKWTIESIKHAAFKSDIYKV